MPLFFSRSKAIGSLWRSILAPLNRTSFAVLACLLGLMLSLWPVAAPGALWSGKLLFGYYFAVWTFLLLINIFIGLRLPPSRNRREEDDS